MVATAPPPIRPADHEGWAASIGRAVSRRWRFRPGSQEQADLVQTALVAMLRAVRRFDPTRLPPGGDVNGLFRGWASQDVRQECQREARRLLNGGTYRTRREHESPRLVKAYSFSDLAARRPSGEFELSDEGRPDAIALPDPDRPPPLYDVTDDYAPAGGRSARYPEACRG